MQNAKSATESEKEHFDNNSLTGISEHELDIPSLDAVIDSIGKGSEVSIAQQILEEQKIEGLESLYLTCDEDDEFDNSKNQILAPRQNDEIQVTERRQQNLDIEMEKTSISSGNYLITCHHESDDLSQEQIITEFNPMDILFEFDQQKGTPTLSGEKANPGTSRLKILISIYSEKYSDDAVDEIQRNIIVGEIMHTLYVSWGSRCILKTNLFNQKDIGKILSLETAAEYIQDLLMRKNTVTSQFPLSFDESNFASRALHDNHVSPISSKASNTPISINTLETSRLIKPFSSETSTLQPMRESEFVPEFPLQSQSQHTAAIESLKLKRKKREIMSRIAGQTTTRKRVRSPTSSPSHSSNI